MKRNLMIQAHKIAKSIVKVVSDYMVAMKIALKQAWEMVSMNIVSEVALKTEQGVAIAKVEGKEVVIESEESGIKYKIKSAKAFSSMAQESPSEIAMSDGDRTILIDATGNIALLNAMMAAAKKSRKLAIFSVGEIENIEEKESTGKVFSIYFDDNNKCVYGAYVY